MTADRIPLPPAARRLWTLSRIRPGDPFFNHPFAVDVAGPLDVALLGGCVGEIVRRHEPLRSRVEDGHYVVQPASLVELSAVDGDEEDAHRFGQEPFDLAAAPPFRVLLLRLGPDRHRLVVNAHHIVIDGLSLDVFMTELVALYAGEELPELPTRFGDLPPVGDDREYWVRRLAGAPVAVELPYVGPRPLVTDHRGARRTRLMPLSVLERVRQVARVGRATPYMALKAACDVLLAHYGNDDVLMGMALAGRDTSAQAALVANLIKPVVLRTHLGDDPTFAEVVRRVRDDVLDAVDHPDLPLEDVLADLGVTRDPGYHPLFQVMFNHDVEPTPRAVGETTFTLRFMRLDTMKVELNIGLLESPRGLEAVFDYRRDLLDESTVDSMLERLEVVLRHVGDHPDARVSELRTIGVAPPAPLAEPVERCVHDLVARWAVDRPDAVAVDADVRWTYRELDDVASGVAGKLAELGVVPGARVAVCAATSAMLPAALLGVLKAGAVAVPLDPALPPYLLRAMAEQCGVDVVLADENAEPVFTSAVRLERWPATPGATAAAPAPSATASAPAAAVAPGDPAFVLHTADGEHAVVVEHRAFANSLRLPVPSPRDVFGLLAPLAAGGTDTPAAMRYVTPETGVALVDGRPLPGVAALVLDERGRPLPPGMTGDLWIGGHGLARGYLDEPDLTERRFRTYQGVRLFDTGDRARLTPDGAVRLVRRVGRVDLDAVESTLTTHPGVRRAVALADENGRAVAVAVTAEQGQALSVAVTAEQGQTVAVAVTAEQGQAVAVSAVRGLRDWLAERLPHYTVPTRVLAVEALPTLPGGRPDRDAVLRLLAETVEEDASDLPLTDAERAVSEAWTAVLGRVVGRRQNFFDAGGDSLLLVRLTERLRTVFDRHIDVIDLFRHPTVQAMAEHLTGGGAQPAPEEAAARGQARRHALREKAKQRG
ncbi:MULTISPECIES: condensation domain-containing protein [unclassified Saccharothrix]|uniref:condensation domain-containing protein n=1 Tax=unclassified Saccharothrix TaxID=2593673 RepID=UPI00307F0429